MVNFVGAGAELEAATSDSFLQSSMSIMPAADVTSNAFNLKKYWRSIFL